MGVTRALLDTREAFDGVAAGYDRSNRDNPLLCAMRDRVQRTITALVPPGSRLLDLGCGPGTDATTMAIAGYRVTAIDWSPAMVDEARRRVVDAGVESSVDVQHVGIHEVDRLEDAAARFDAAYANFGPLNCVADLAAAAPRLAATLRPGGLLIASVIGRVCPWEIALYAARGNWSRALIRFRRGVVPVPLDGRTVWTRYISPGECERAFAPAGLRRVSLRALGLLTPPPYLQAFADRHPALVDRLQRAEDRCAGWPVLRGWGDHFVIVMRKA
ncbi:MAG: class SAM-dependent methyltransferase [Acidobacteria bacterium]|nr:class SAM-dependent methyltransferase [Acidobacteriota bacterium]